MARLGRAFPNRMHQPAPLVSAAPPSTPANYVPVIQGNFVTEAPPYAKSLSPPGPGTPPIWFIPGTTRANFFTESPATALYVFTPSPGVPPIWFSPPLTKATNLPQPLLPSSLIPGFFVAPPPSTAGFYVPVLIANRVTEAPAFAPGQLVAIGPGVAPIWWMPRPTTAEARPLPVLPNGSKITSGIQVTKSTTPSNFLIFFG